MITGCTLLRTGCLVLVDKANSFVKILNTTNKNIKFEKPPYDITEKDDNLCVSIPNACKIALIEDLKGRGTMQVIINTATKCYGIENGGGNLLIMCHTRNYTYHWFPSLLSRNLPFGSIIHYNFLPAKSVLKGLVVVLCILMINPESCLFLRESEATHFMNTVSSSRNFLADCSHWIQI